MLERETGLEISRATMDGWVMTVGGLLIPMAAAMGRELVRGTYVQAVKLRWMCRCTTGAGRIIRLTYGNTVGREGAWCSTSGWVGGARVRGNSWRDTGLLQTDGYAAYDKVGGPSWCMPPVGATRDVSFTKPIKCPRARV